MPSFYNGKRFFLTYPRCEHTKEELLEFLSEKAEVSHYTICRELHEDGTPHLHACVEFLETQRHPVAWLDFDGKHPNKQDPRSWVKCRQYCKKGGDFIEDVAADTVIGAALAPSLECATFEKKEDWFDHCCVEKHSFQYACFFWDRLHSAVPTINDDLHIGKMCKALETFKFVPELHKTLVLLGKSGCGKTTWAKVNAPKPALFVSHIDDLKLFSFEHKSIIFDDVDFNHFPRTSQIHLCDFDNPRSIHCRHAVARIPAGVFKIFTANVMPVNVGDPAVKRRVRVFNVINQEIY